MERRDALSFIFVKGPLSAAASLGLISCGSKLKLETTNKLVPTAVLRPTAHHDTRQTPAPVISAQFAPETTPNGADLLEKASWMAIAKRHTSGAATYTMLMVQPI